MQPADAEDQAGRPQLRYHPPASLKWQLVGTLLGAVGVASIGWADVRTGSHVALSPLYVVPVVMAGWWLGRAPAIVLAFCASGAWFAAERLLMGPMHPAIHLWNAAERLSIYGALGILTAIVRNDRRRLRELLARETSNARTDVLTGLANARAFRDLLTTELARRARTGRSLCLAILDLDNFKHVNDRLGHSAGDAVLVEFAALLRRSVRATDVAVRQGGDEFAVLFYEVDLEQALEICRRVIEAVGQLAASYPGHNLGASIGLACFHRLPADVEEVIRRADAAMYRAKAAGKSQVCVDEVGPLEAVQARPVAPVGRG